jgi:hypothetical protein
MLTGTESAKYNRKPEIMADAAYAILTKDPKTTTGNFFVDDDVLREHGVTDFDQYCVDPAYKDQLMPDFFLDEAAAVPPSDGRPSLATPKTQGGGKIAPIFQAIEKNLSPTTVQQTQAVFQFVVTGDESGKWSGTLVLSPDC